MARDPIIAGMRPKRAASLQALAALLASGERVFLPGSTGDPAGLGDALFREGAPPLTVTSSYVPGVNTVPAERFPKGTIWTGMFAHPNAAGAQARGVYRHLPISYGAFANHVHNHLQFDTTIVHVAPPDADGNCSFGPAVEFAPIAVRKSKRVLAVINPRIPRIRHSATLPFRNFDAIAEIDAPLRCYEVGTPSSQANAIAGLLEKYVGDDVTLQVGLGKVPDALMARLTDRRGLKLFSGMLPDGARWAISRISRTRAPGTGSGLKARTEMRAATASVTVIATPRTWRHSFLLWVALRPGVKARGVH